MDVLIVTNNKHKLKEISAIVKTIIPEGNFLCLKDIEYSKDIKEDADTFEGNALIKAKALEGRGYITVADDSGLMVDALNGAPGVYSARFSGDECDDDRNNTKLLKLMENIPIEKRTAKFVSAIACVFPDGRYFTVRGECPGMILTEHRGTGGFGYDPLFLYEDLDKTFAEITEDEKNTISHRARALALFSVKFKEMIKNKDS